MELKINVQEPSHCKRTLDIVVPVEKTEEERGKALKKLRQMAVVPGFRPGKAPVALLERYYKKAIIQEIMENTLPDTLKSAMESSNLNPVGEPRLLRSDYDLGTPMELTVEIDVLPQVELKDYHGLEVEYRPREFDLQDVEDEIEHLRSRFSTPEVILGQPSELGDLVEVDIEVTPENETEPLLVKSLRHLRGEKGPNAFLDKVLGNAAAGDRVEFSHTFPPDHYDIRLAGKTAAGDVRVVSIQREVLPELNDELAKKAGDFENLAAMREAMEKHLRLHIESENKENLESALIRSLLSDYDFDVPETMVETLFRGRATDTVQRLLSYGMTEEKIQKLDWAAMRQKDEESLKAAVRRTILLDQIARKEGITISDEDADQEIALQASQAEITPEEFRRNLVKDADAIPRLKESLRFRKAIETLLQTAKIVEPRKAPLAVPEAAEKSAPGEE
ncbi:MAG: trigger factor [Acidobacteria bacterium]|nr:trigger factor [Acidobacteriota bacterium]